MDMNMGGMGSMGGMDTGSASMFQTTNKHVALIFWYFVIAVVTLCAIRRGIDAVRAMYLTRKSDTRIDVPSKPSNFMSQAYHTVVATCRELTYPQFRPFTGSLTKYFSTLPLGQTLLILGYWTMILIMLWSNVILRPSSEIYGYKWEIVGFRAAWVSVTQLPLIYCLGGKANIISLITGISYERLNWLHRWVARTIFLTVIVHWSFFFREWWLADFVKDEIQMMPMVKYGFGAWGVIGWSVITGFGFFRTKTYELWLLQHLATAGVLLWLLYCHVPAYARYNIWLSIGFVAFDRGIRGIWSLARNTHVARLWNNIAGSQSLIGFDAKVESHGQGYMSLTILNVNFMWQPGQHVFISMPACGIFESHPFTIASSPSSSLQLYFKGHSGFTGRLLKKADAGKTESIRTFISGPWGNPPISEIEMCNSLVFVSSSTGAAFTVPLLEHAINKAKFVQRISFHWIIRHDSQLKVFMPRIAQAMQSARQLKIEAECRIFITTKTGNLPLSRATSTEKASTAPSSSEGSLVKEILPVISTIAYQPSHVDEKCKNEVGAVVRNVSATSQSASSENNSLSDASVSPASNIIFNQGRPTSWDELLHPVIVEAEGETVVVACGGNALMADIRNYVAWLSDQRAVHKGTGAQGIYLHTESYGW